MGLRTISRTAEERELLTKRFRTAQAAPPEDVEERKSVQHDIQSFILNAGDLIDDEIENSREKSLALTHLEEALMWAGKAIFA